MSNTNPAVGTWKLDVGKSNFSPVFLALMHATPPKEETILIREVGTDEFELTVTGVQTDGKPIAAKSTAPRQGGAVKIQQGPFPEGMAIVSTRIDPNNGYATYMMNGKQIFVAQTAISENGKTMQVTTGGMDAQGKPFEQLLVFAKQ
jgi:hypothetical protein